MYSRTGTLIQKKYHEYLLPAVMSAAALAVASLVDSMLVGNLLGPEALAGVGACSPFIALGNAMFLIFSVGGSTCASVALGECDRKKANLCYSTGVYFGFFCVTIIVLIMEAFSPVICSLMCYGNEGLTANMLSYLRPLLFVFPTLFLTLGIAQYMRIDGHPKMGSYIAVGSNAVNLVLDYIFLKYLNMGVTGAGLSTLCGYIFGIFMVLPWLLSKDRSFKAVNPLPELIPTVKEVFSAGSARFFLHLADFGRRFFLNSIVLFHLGDPGLSVLTACNSLVFFSTSITNGGSDAFLPIVGSLMGEKDYFGIRECIKSAVRFVLAGCIVFSLVLFIAPAAIGGLYGLNSGEAGRLAPRAIRILSFSFPFLGLISVLQTNYNTTGRHKISIAISVLSNMVYLSIFVALFGLINKEILWAGFPASYIVSLITVYIYILYIRKKEGLTGFLLLKEPGSDVIIRSVTIEASKETAAGLSEKVQENMSMLSLDPRTANHIAVAVEEMAVSVAERREDRGEKPLIDISFILDKEEKRVSFRENGPLFNPLAEETEETNEGDDPETADPLGSSRQVIKSLCKSYDFSRQLGFNTTILNF